MSLRSLGNVGKVGIEKNGRALNNFYIVKKVRFVIFQLNYLYLGLGIGVDFFIKWELMQLGVLLISKLLVWRTWNPKCLPAQWMHALATQLTVISWGALHSNGKSIIWFSLGLFLRSLNLNRLYPLNQFCKQNFFGKILLEGVFLVICGTSCIDLWALRG